MVTHFILMCLGLNLEQHIYRLGIDQKYQLVVLNESIGGSKDGLLEYLVLDSLLESLDGRNYFPLTVTLKQRILAQCFQEQFEFYNLIAVVAVRKA